MFVKEFEKVRMFRCVKDPMIPGVQKPRQAFLVSDLRDAEVYYQTKTGNLWVHCHDLKRTVIIGVGNIEMVEIEYRGKEDGPVQTELRAVGEEVSQTGARTTKKTK